MFRNATNIEQPVRAPDHRHFVTGMPIEAFASDSTSAFLDRGR